jgi:hypothetical protein
MATGPIVRFLALATCLLGCSETPPPVTPAPSGVMGLRMFVRTATIKSTDGHCRKDLLEKTLANELRGRLLRSGYTVASGDTDRYDVTWTITLSASDCLAMDSRVLVGNVEATAESSDGVLYVGKAVSGMMAGLSDDWAQPLVNDFTGSPAVVALARVRSTTSGARADAARSPPSAVVASGAHRAPASSASFKLRGGPVRGNAWALVIGIEKYRDVPPPTGARADALHFAELAKTTLGVPGDHLRVAMDERATKADIERELGWLSASVPMGSRVYFFFAGHGAPDAARGTPFLLPYDGDPKYVDSSALPLDKVLESLGSTKAQEVVAFVDACFSGAGGRSVLPPGTRALVRVREAPRSFTPKVALFSSSGGTEISGPTHGGSEGLFTRVLIEALGAGAADIDGDGNVSLGEVVSWVRPRVAREARQDNRDQNPTLTAGTAVGDPATLILASGLAP